MTIKQQVLKVLLENKGKSVSGEELGKQLYCSRNAVWKAIKSLRDEGYKIVASTNKGYSLIEETAALTVETIKKYINCDCEITLIDKIDSTNNFIKQKADEGEKEGFVAVAKRQTGGKGRLGRSFFSPESGTYLSILLRPDFSAEKSLFITTAAAVAVCRTIEKVSNKQAGIKWVNDVFIGNKKVCGILTEASVDFETGGLFYAVVGIGVNLYHPKDNFPKDIQQIAGTVFDENIDNDLKSKFIAEIINSFFEIYNNFENSDFMKEYKQKSIIIGKKVTVIKGKDRQNAVALDIDDNARLLVEYENGEKEKLFSGEVSIKV